MKSAGKYSFHGAERTEYEYRNVGSDNTITLCSVARLSGIVETSPPPATTSGTFHKIIPLLEELRGMNVNYRDLNNKLLTISVKSV